MLARFRTLMSEIWDERVDLLAPLPKPVAEAVADNIPVVTAPEAPAKLQRRDLVAEYILSHPNDPALKQAYLLYAGKLPRP